MPGKPIPFGPYLLLERLAMGGMAEVFLAKSQGPAGFEKLVAVKRILPNIAEDNEFINMFIDEAKIAGQLAHTGIAQIFDLGKINSLYYIAMEYVPGVDLRALWDRARAQGGLPLQVACHIVIQMCEALDYAHRRKDARGRPMGIIHRDISPQNVLCSWDGDVKIIDFGIAKAANRLVKTQAGILKGKFAYMAPEQAKGAALDHRADVFAIGVVLYELVTGARLYQAESDFSLLEKVRKVDVPAPRAVRPDLPAELERIVLKALAQRPEERYGYASAMQGDLERFLVSTRKSCSREDLGALVRQSFPEDHKREQQRQQDFRQLQQQEQAAEPADDEVPGIPPKEGTAVLDFSGSHKAVESGATHFPLEPPAPENEFDGPMESTSLMDRSQLPGGRRADEQTGDLEAKSPATGGWTGTAVDIRAVPDIRPAMASHLEGGGRRRAADKRAAKAAADLSAEATDESLEGAKSPKRREGGAEPRERFPVEDQPTSDAEGLDPDSFPRPPRPDVDDDEKITETPEFAAVARQGSRQGPTSPRVEQALDRAAPPVRPPVVDPVEPSEGSAPVPAPPGRASAKTLAITGGAGLLLGILLTVVAYQTPVLGRGTLVVLANKASARISINDGAETTGAWLIQPMRLGTHKVTISVEGFQPDIRQVSVSAGQPALVLFNGKSERGTLVIKSTPPGAAVILNGNKLPGSTPMTVDDLEPGSSQEVVLRHPDTEQVKKTIKVVAGEEYKVDALLPYKLSRVVVEPTPDDAAVVWDGAFRGRGRAVIRGARLNIKSLLKVYRPGCSPTELEIMPTGEQEIVKQVALTCQRMDAAINLGSPVGARLRVDELDTGVDLPVRDYRLPVGRHAFELVGGRKVMRWFQDLRVGEQDLQPR